MNENLVLVVFSGLVIFSYLFEIISKKTHIPSVLLLLSTGILIKIILDSLGIVDSGMKEVLPILGTLGLILIVLEGSLDLKYERAKRKAILKALLSALIIMLVSIGLISFFFYMLGSYTYDICILNSLPFCIISSAIAIPSASVLNSKQKEFIIYESTFSDILGIILFNFFLYNQGFEIYSFTSAGFEIILTLVIAFVMCFILVYLIGIITHHVKFFLILSVLILSYALSKAFHLSALIIVFVFGLFLSNIKIINPPLLKRIYLNENFSKDIQQLSSLTAESSFLVRTFFFLVFGYIISLRSLIDPMSILYGVIILGVIYLARYAYLFIFNARSVNPEIYISPRGLISILLFLNIPPDKMIFGEEGGLLFFVILATSIIMAIGIIQSKKT